MVKEEDEAPGGELTLSTQMTHRILHLKPVLLPDVTPGN